MALPPEIVSQLPEDIQSHPALESVNDIPTLAKNYLETKAFVGRSIQLPNGESKPEDFDKWANEQSVKLKDHGFHIAKLSERAPEKPDGYEFKFEGVTPEQLKDDKILGAFKPIAHKLGLNNAQANALVTHFAKDLLPALAEGMPKPAEFIEGDGVKALMQKTFGRDTDAAVAEFRSGVKQLSTEIPELGDVLNEGVVGIDGKFIALGDHPAIVTLVREVAKMKAQDFGGNLDGVIGGETLEGINEKITALRNDPAFLKMSEEQQGEKMAALYKVKDAIIKKSERRN